MFAVAEDLSYCINAGECDTAGGYYKATAIIWAVPDQTQVPEPATMFLFGLALLGVAGVNRRKN